MHYSETTEALLHAIKNDVRNRVDDIVDYAEHAAMTLTSETEVDAVLEQALAAVEKTLAEAADVLALSLLAFLPHVIDIHVWIGWPDAGNRCTERANIRRMVGAGLVAPCGCMCNSRSHLRLRKTTAARWPRSCRIRWFTVSRAFTARSVCPTRALAPVGYSRKAETQWTRRGR